jgi:hypothetical protein
MKQIIVADKNNNLIQFNFFDIDKMKVNKIKSENREFALNISIIIIACSLILFICSFLFLLFSYSTMSKITETIFTLTMTWIIRISIIIFIITAFVFAVLKTGGTNYGVYNDIIALYDYIYKDDFSKITFDCLDDNNYIGFENIDFANIDFPIVLKTNQIIYEKNLDVNYIIDIGIYKEIYYCNVTSKGK